MNAVAAQAIRRTGAVQPGGKLVEIGFPERYCAQRNQLCNNGRVVLRPVGKRRAGSGGFNPARSMLSLMANGMPYSGNDAGSAFQRREVRLQLGWCQDINEGIKLRV
jgi:hypothetical protein